MREYILNFLNANKIICHGQHGFLPKHSTITQLISCLDFWTRTIDENRTVDVIYLDIAKAFDSVSHIKLIQKMISYGFHVKVVNWVQSYLSGRSQFVQIDDSVSRNCSVTSGVPQGSLLGPVLFLIYINDLIDYIKSASFKFYADDAKIYISTSKNTQNTELVYELGQVMRWAKNVQLQIAVSKCVVLQIGYGNAKTKYEIENVSVPSVSVVRDLGVWFSEDLKFSVHCRNLAYKASIVSSLIFKVFRCRNREFLIKMYTTFVRSKLEYVTEIWNPFQIGDIDRIERVQRSFTRRIPGLVGLSYVERLTEIQLEFLEHRRTVRDLVFVYKMLFGLVAVSFSDFFEFTSRSGLRKNHNYCLKWNRANKEILNNFFSIRIVPVWNALPSNIFEMKTVSGFRQSLSKLDFTQFLKGTAIAGNRPSRSLASIQQ